MRSTGRLALLFGLAAVVAAGQGFAQSTGVSGVRGGKGSGAKPAPVTKPADPAKGPSNLPTIRLGALLPLTGVAAWYGQEMRQGLELAIASLTRPPGPAPASEDTTRQGGSAKRPPEDAQPENHPAVSADATEVEDPGPPAPTFQLVLQALDVHAPNLKQAQEQFAKLAATQPTAIFTASATPTLTVQPLAAARNVLLVHQGVVTGRFPAASRIILHTRPSTAARAEALAAYAWETGFRRLALLAAGDELGKAVRAVLPERWRERGGPPVDAESLSLDAPDLRARLRRLAARAPDAMVLAFRGPDLGDLARAVREAGYAGPLLALDEDPAVLLAAGPGLDNMTVLAEVFLVPPDTPAAAAFATAYQARYRTPPSRYAANAYDAVGMLVAALGAAREAGQEMPGGARLLTTLMAQRRFPSVYGGEVLLRDDGSVDRPLAVVRIERGTPVFVRYLQVAAGNAGTPPATSPAPPARGPGG